MKNRGSPFICLLVLTASFEAGPCWAQGYTITTFAGGIYYSQSSGIGDGGPATAASISPAGLAMDGGGNLDIADFANNVVRKVTPDGLITSIAGDAMGQRPGYAGDQGPATSALLNGPVGVAIDSGGNLYVSEQVGRVRKVDTNGIITVAGGGSLGTDGVLAVQTFLGGIRGVAVDTSGNIYIAGTQFQTVRKVAPDGTITTAAGCGSGAIRLAPDGTAILCGLGTLNDGGPATNAWLDMPMWVAVDTGGNLYISDLFFQRIRKVTGDGKITTVAGSGAGTYSGDGGSAVNAGLSFPTGIAVDAASGNLYIAEYS